MDELMIKAENVAKEYTLGQIGSTTLREELQRIGARLRHKDDPTAKIGISAAQSGRRFKALDGVSFAVKKGERVGIIGHNGAGKSTLLKLLSRVTAPSDGIIGLNGRVACMLEVGTGFHPELTGRENIYMNGAILGMSKKEIDSKIEDIIDFSECRQFIDTPVKRYSSGMYVKLAFSVAAHLDSEIMIMDEVLAVGDMKFQEKCIGKMNDVSKTSNRTILYVSHNMNTIRNLCTRCIVLSHGKIIYDGDVEKAISIYMDSVELSDCDLDLTNLERPVKFQLSPVRFKRLIVDAGKSIFETGSVISGHFVISSDESLSRIRLEIPIRTPDGESVTRFLSEPIISVSENVENSVDFILDISALAPGKYTMNPVLRAVNSWGSEKSYDGLLNAYCFEIIPSANFNNGTEWLTRYSGHYVAPPIELKMREETER